MTVRITAQSCTEMPINIAAETVTGGADLIASTVKS